MEILSEEFWGWGWGSQCDPEYCQAAPRPPNQFSMQICGLGMRWCFSGADQVSQRKIKQVLCVCVCFFVGEPGFDLKSPYIFQGKPQQIVDHPHPQ